MILTQSSPLAASAFKSNDFFDVLLHASALGLD